MLKNFNFYIYAILAITLGFLYLRLDSTKARLEKSQSDLKLAINTNEQLTRNTRQLELRHKQELEALTQNYTQKNKIKEKVENVKTSIENSNENNTTKLFNAMVNRLWDNNASGK
ncbi:hypothetical protein [Campylobacter sp. CCS1377]|uniref:DUF1374 domain-containing protein n=1 Tax=Campylobacter sp. CCS1377 TaxID=3158229 RepID=A0AAU7E3M2_9BACT